MSKLPDCECGYRRRDRSNFRRHQRENCPLRKISSQVNTLAKECQCVQTEEVAMNAPPDLLQVITDMQQRMAAWQLSTDAKLAEMQTQINKLQNKRAEQVSPYPFGHEPLEELPTRDKVRRFLQKPRESFAALFRLILKNPKTCNVKFSNVRGQYIKVYRESGWCYETTKGVMLEIVSHLFRLMCDVYGATNVVIFRLWVEENMFDMVPKEDKCTDPMWKHQMKRCKEILLELRKGIVTAPTKSTGVDHTITEAPKEELKDETNADSKEENVVVNEEDEGIEDQSEYEGSGEESEDGSTSDDESADECRRKIPPTPKPKTIQISTAPNACPSEHVQHLTGTYVPFGGLYNDIYVSQGKLTKSVKDLGYPDNSLLDGLSMSFKWQDDKWTLVAKEGEYDPGFARGTLGTWTVWDEATNTWVTDKSIFCTF